MAKGLYIHLKEAIEINSERKVIYAQKTDGKSSSLSRRMILSERLLLPIAKYFDRQGKPFNDKGIGIVADDFISMEDIKSVDEPLTYQNIASSAQYDQLSEKLKHYMSQAYSLIDAMAFKELCEITESMMQQVAELEQSSESHFAMLYHILESIGFGSMNAIHYSQMSRGDTDRLAARLLKIQVFSLKDGLKIDKKAQQIHHLGAGIIINDVPHIPFLSQWQLIKNKT